MKARPTLYELLGVPQAASSPEIDAAFRREYNALEARRATLSPQEFDDRAQLLRLARSTLVDPVSRTGYDHKLEAQARATPAGAAARALSLRDDDAPDPAANAAHVAAVRADALSLRADALSLRADAMLARAGLAVPPQSPGVGRALAGGLLTGASRLVRALGLLVVIGVVTFMIARCSFAGSEQQRMAAQQKAAEQAALQEYFQTHGVRPANMAELELLEAERRRRDNEQRQAEQNRRQQEAEQRRFEEESRRRGQEVSSELRRSEEQARYEQLRDEQIKLREEETKLQRERVQAERERMRQEAQRKQWQETLKR